MQIRGLPEGHLGVQRSIRERTEGTSDFEGAMVQKGKESLEWRGGIKCVHSWGGSLGCERSRKGGKVREGALISKEGLKMRCDTGAFECERMKKKGSEGRGKGKGETHQRTQRKSIKRALS